MTKGAVINDRSFLEIQMGAPSRSDGNVMLSPRAWNSPVEKAIGCNKFLTGRRAPSHWYHGDEFSFRIFSKPDNHDEVRKLERLVF